MCVGVKRVSVREREQGSKAPIMIRSENDHFGLLKTIQFPALEKKKTIEGEETIMTGRIQKSNSRRKGKKDFFSDRLKIQL